MKRLERSKDTLGLFSVFCESMGILESLIIQLKQFSRSLGNLDQYNYAVNGFINCFLSDILRHVA